VRGFMNISVEFVAFAFVPPVAMNWLAFRAYDLDMSYTHLENPMGVLVGIAVGLVIWAGFAWWLWKLTVRRFNLLAGERFTSWTRPSPPIIRNSGRWPA